MTDDLYERYKDEIEQVIQLGIPSSVPLGKLKSEQALRELWKIDLNNQESINTCQMRGVYEDIADVENLITAAEEMLLDKDKEGEKYWEREKVSRLRKALNSELERKIQDCTCSIIPKGPQIKDRGMVPVITKYEKGHPAQQQIKTIHDDIYREQHPVKGQIKSRYQTLVDLYGIGDADRVMRELEINPGNLSLSVSHFG